MFGAKKKLSALSVEVGAYMDPPPFRIAVEAVGNRQAVVCRIERPADDSWADEMAEIAYQARSALDLLIPQLVIDSGNTPKRGTQFPIFLDRDAYVNKGRSGTSNRDRMLKGVAKRHRSVIEEAQPYQRGEVRIAIRSPFSARSATATSTTTSTSALPPSAIPRSSSFVRRCLLRRGN